MEYFEVIARYAHGTCAHVVKAASAEAAIAAARPTLRRMIPDAYSIAAIWVVRA